MSLRASASSFLHFLLALTGVTCLVAGTWNLPRHAHIERLEQRRQKLEATLNALERRRSEVRRCEHALYHDPYYRERILRRLMGTPRSDELTLDEWIQERRSRRGGKPIKDPL